MSDRLTCCITGCHYTIGKRRLGGCTENTEWICAAHWRLISRAARSTFLRAKRRCTARPNQNNIAAENRLWEHMKRLAHEGMLR